ncbi:hypothetical protein N657DRAFT_681294 [Parathielavia appendiculata]|uniref:RING-type domain-containing protein n=1 Tax=Parathielavia appendiculata TaxID=2587402 RepID=A0AAN6Z3X1_9PEZI|nr:hypothetical protein N657DRAFT_681294 [Parathielavia appendiculata]
MSTSSRRRSSRPTDLSLPSAPSHARPPSRSSGNPRRSAPRPLQPEQASSATKRKREADDDVDLFGDDLFGGAEVVDLVDTDEVPANILESQGKVKKLVRLSSFDCVICMDSAKDLTVTHCGHLFCSACLHSALNMEVTRRICPICRQKIDRPTAANGKFGRNAKGFYPLELKLMTRKTLGGTVDPPQ